MFLRLSGVEWLVCVRLTRSRNFWFAASHIDWGFDSVSTEEICQAVQTSPFRGLKRPFSSMAVSGIGTAAH
jgi:hypothetical protein